MTGKTGGAKTRKPVSEPQKADLINFYRDMLLIRRFEEKAGQLLSLIHI